MTDFSINGKKVSVDVDADTPLLWILRDELVGWGWNPGAVRTPAQH